MDEIKDLCTHARERFDQGEIRYQFESDRVHVDRIDTIASAMASVESFKAASTASRKASCENSPGTGLFLSS